MFSSNGGGLSITHQNDENPSDHQDVGGRRIYLETNFQGAGMRLYNGASFFSVLRSSATQNRVLNLPDESGTVALLTDITAGGTTFVDATWVIQNDADNSKQAQFDASLISPSTTGIYQFPNKNGTFAMTSDVDATNSAQYSAYRTGCTTTTYASGSPVDIILGCTLFDPGNNFAGTDTYTVPVDGLYEVTIQLVWEANSNGHRTASILPPPSQPGFVPIPYSIDRRGAIANSVPTTVRTSSLRRLNAGDTISPGGLQDSGTSLRVISGANASYMYVTFLGPL